MDLQGKGTRQDKITNLINSIIFKGLTVNFEREKISRTTGPKKTKEGL